MKKILVLFAIGALSSLFASAQTVLDGVYVKEHVQTRKVVPYAPLREADVMWSKRIWRYIDINEKINIPLKYPLSHSIKDRKSLIDVIHDAVKEGTLTAYNQSDDEFTTPLTQSEAQAIGVSDDTTEVVDPTTGETSKKIVHEEFKGDNVIKYRLKEDWFFDRQRSVMDVRIIGIAPIMQKINKETGEAMEGDLVIYWIYFPEARKLLVNNEVFNRFNDAERRSFDDIFMKRMFSSVIFKESNVIDRRIPDYKTNTLDALLEAQKIKEDLFNMEHDLWEY